jgi:hypothetical protein
MRRHSIVYALLVGSGMLGMWGMLLATGQVPEVHSEPVRLGFHLAAEGMTGVALIVAGVALMRRRGWARSVYLLAVGMLLYTLVVSPGYYAQLGETVFVVMFAMFLVGALVAVTWVWRAA